MTLTKPLDHSQTGVPALDAAVVAGRVRELEEQLARERARCAGLEQGIAALTSTIAELRTRLGEPA
jgi:hypothetical protein